MRRKFKSLILLVVIVLASTQVNIVGMAGASPNLKVASVAVNSGDNVSIPVVIQNNPGIAAFQIDLVFDNEVLLPLSVKQGAVLSSALIYNLTYKAGTIRIVYAAATNFTGDGELFSVEFKAMGNFSEQKKSPVVLKIDAIGGISDNQIVNLSAVSDNGIVTVEPIQRPQTPPAAEMNPADGGKQNEKDNTSPPVDTASPKQASFSDVTGSYDWAKPYIDYIAQRGIIAGIGGNKFGPGSSIKRGDFVKILAGVAGIKADSIQESAKFADVKSDHPYSKIIAWAVQAGIVAGYEDSTFRPDSFITREDIAVMLFRLAKHLNFSLPSKITQATFVDDAQISGYAKEAVYKMQKAGILSGKGKNIFSPKQTASRAETAKMIAVLLQEMDQ